MVFPDMLTNVNCDRRVRADPMVWSVCRTEICSVLAVLAQSDPDFGPSLRHWCHWCPEMGME